MAWERDDDISTLLPALVHYEAPDAASGTQLQEKLWAIPLDALEKATELSRHTPVRVRRGQQVYERSLDISCSRPEHFLLVLR